MGLRKYRKVEGSIANGQTDIDIFPDGITTAYQAEILNDSLTGDLLVKYVDGFGDEGEDYTLKAGEVENEDEVEITGLKLSNSSGVTINYRIKLWGEE